MMKQSKRMGLAVVYMLVALFIGGCTSKTEVGYNNAANNNASSTSATGDTTNKIGGSYINVTTSNVNGTDVSLNSVHFAFDKYSLTDEMRIIIKDNNKIIDPLVVEHNNLKIKLEGNCDEWGSDEYNYALGLKRAKTVKDALVNDGIPSNKILLVSFGESNPLCNSKDDACWKQNRRVDHRLLP